MELAKTKVKRSNKKDPGYRDQLITEYLPYVKRIVQIGYGVSGVTEFVLIKTPGYFFDTRTPNCMPITFRR